MLTAQYPLSVCQHVLGRRLFIDGEVFLYKTQSPDTLRPRLQIIESHRVANPGTDRCEQTGNLICDGVEVNDSGRPVAYHVSQRPQNSSYGLWQNTSMPSGFVIGSSTLNQFSQPAVYKRIPAEQIVHLYEPERADALRGISHLYPVMRHIHDLYDLKKLEYIAAKDQAETSIFVTNAAGQATGKAVRAAELALQSGDAKAKNGKPVTGVRRTAGGRTVYMRTGEQVTLSAPSRPTVTSQWFFDWTVKNICLGVNISPLLVFPWSLQGAVTRADLDTMAANFRTKSALAAAAMREVYVWALGWAVRYDRALDGYPRDWAEVTVRPPKSVSVDVGRNSQALIAEYEAGFRTLQDICAEMGLDWRHQIRQGFTEQKFINDCVADPKYKGVTREQVIKLVSKQATSPSSPAPAKNEAESWERFLKADEAAQAASVELAGV
jgi:capsid protein